MPRQQRQRSSHPGRPAGQGLRPGPRPSCHGARQGKMHSATRPLHPHFSEVATCPRAHTPPSTRRHRTIHRTRNSPPASLQTSAASTSRSATPSRRCAASKWSSSWTRGRNAIPQSRSALIPSGAAHPLPLTPPSHAARVATTHLPTNTRTPSSQRPHLCRLARV